MLRRNRFPGGKIKAITMSYDDGTTYDRKLVEIFNKYGIKGTFNLCSGLLDRDTFLPKNEIASLYKGHEIALHTVNHPDLTTLTAKDMIDEIIADKYALEELTGEIVSGMAYPGGAYNLGLINILSALGIEYARTVVSTGNFRMPIFPLEWHPTCHHSENIMGRFESFMQSKNEGQNLLYIWGHSSEFRDGFDEIENFCKHISGFDDIWFATNIEIISYQKALQSLKTSADGRIIKNPSAIPVWLETDSGIICIKSGETIAVE